MNIIVCVKQTPEAGKGELDPHKGLVKRTQGRQMINPFDLYAMEAALRLQEKDPDTRIIALSMGPASAASVLRDCIALGAETGYLVCDEAFAGSDVRGTARLLARAVRVIEEREGIRADAVFCGAKTVDGGTSMLGPELAQVLGLPQVTYVLHCGPGEEGLRAEKEDDRGNRIYSVPIPCLMTFTKASFEVRYPMIARILQAESMELPVLGAADLFAEDSSSPEAAGASLSGAGAAASADAAGTAGAGAAGASSSGAGAADSADVAGTAGAGAAASADAAGTAGAAGAAIEVLEVELRKMEKQSQIIEDPDPVKAVTALAQKLFSEGIL